MISFNLSDAVYGTIKRRVDYLEGNNQIWLAARITASTPGAVPCPSCWDAVRHQVTSPEDPTCLGGGFVIPGPSGVADPATQRGYQTPVPFDAVLSTGTTQTSLGEMGYVEATQATLVWPEQGIHPKAGDAVIVVNPIEAPESDRYLLGDVATAGNLGARDLLHQAPLTEQRRESPIYQLVIPGSRQDVTPDVPGSWS